MKAITHHIDAELCSQRLTPMSIEGVSTSQWVLMDFGDVITHIFRADIREHYGLEKLWRDAKRVYLPTDALVSSPAAGRATGARTPRAQRHG